MRDIFRLRHESMASYYARKIWNDIAPWIAGFIAGCCIALMLFYSIK